MKSLILAAVLSAYSSLSLGHEVGLKKGVLFEAARKDLVRRGWKPLKNQTDPQECLTLEKKLVSHGYVEVESCAMDRQVCLFNYRDGNECLHVMTVGEQIKTMKIDFWSNECKGLK